MKPIKLIISGIGPYAELMPEIDFTKFAHNKPVLISGETGAGKTMLFDAICFALFDSVSGSYRTADGMRSEYAAPETKSFVDFYFEHQGKSCHVYRQPAYMRPKKKGTGMLQEKEKAILYVGDEQPIEGQNAVNLAVKELLHVDARQFKQLAMIAQGEFWGLLNAKTEERTAILRNIFQTDGYKRIEYELRDRRNQLTKELERVERSIGQYFAEVRADAESEILPELEELQARVSTGGVHKVSEMLALIERLADEDAPREQAQVEQMAELQARLEKLQQDLTLATSNEHNAAELQRLTGEAEKLRREIAGEAGEVEALAGEEQALAAKIAQLEEQQSALKGVPELLLKCEQELKEISELLQRIIELKEGNFFKYGEAKAKMEQAQAELLTQQEAYRQANQAAVEGELRLERDRAGILAQNLQAGEPCPVCGSREHPAPAQLTGEAITEAAVKELKNAESKALKQKEKAATEAAAAQAAFVEKEKFVLQYMLDCVENNVMTEAVGKKLLPEQANNLTMREVYELLMVGRQALAVAQKEKNEQQNELAKRAKLLQETERALTQARGAETQNLQKKKQALVDRQQKRKNTLAAIEGQMATLQALLASAGNSAAELKAYKDTLLQQIAEVKDGQKKEQKQLDTIRQRRQNNDSRHARIAELETDFAKYQHQNHITTTLYNLVSGQTGNGKLTLEQYIQAAGFDSIIHAANRRLGPMSDGQYELYRQEGQLGNKSHTYLDLEVLDNYTGHRRPVKNLSGGESFKASLSLALGLSDRVSSELGGIAMDALFIDEGFGTLDKRSIERAMEILLRLSDSNKLVAIISHREELMEAIGQQIQVTKNRSGSHISVVTEN